MTTIEGIECLVLIMIVENFTVLKITSLGGFKFPKLSKYTTRFPCFL